MKKERVELLDSFRCLAIMAVMLMHFTYRWTPPAYTENLYPYGNFYGTTFYYGYLGVQFFFIISGFVISYSLENTNSISTFFKNRFIRLFPPMLLCSLITFGIAIWLDDGNVFNNAHTLRNFLPSLTFTKPSLWSVVTHKDFSYISLSYWSLWVEVQFYAIAACIFFINKKNFLRSLVLLTLLINIFNHIPDSIINPETYSHTPKWLNSLLTIWYYNRLHFDLKFYLSWFTIGVLFHHLYQQRKIAWNTVTGIGVLFILINQLFVLKEPALITAYILMLALFCCMLYKQSILAFMDNSFFRRIGVISYTIYLIHEIVGVLLINKLGPYFGKWSPLAVFLVAGLIIAFADLSFRYYEKYAVKWLKYIFFKNSGNNNTMPPNKPFMEPIPVPLGHDQSNDGPDPRS